jgi:hypothetical protein
MDSTVVKLIRDFYIPTPKMIPLYDALKPFVYTLKAGSLCYRYENLKNKQEIKWYSFYRTLSETEGKEMARNMWGKRCSKGNPCKMLVMKVKHDINLLAIPYKSVFFLPKTSEDDLLLQILLDLAKDEAECIRMSLRHLIGQESDEGMFTLRPDWDLMNFLCRIHLNGMIRVIDQDEDTPIVEYINQNVNINRADEIALCDSSCLEIIDESEFVS